MKNLKIVWLILLTICCVGSIFAQSQPKPPEFCKLYNDKDFKGEAVDYDVTRAKLTNILGYLNETLGCVFVADIEISEELEKEDVNIKAKGLPWNESLKIILQNKGLAIQVYDSFLRVRKDENNLEGIKYRSIIADQETLYTEYINLKRLSVVDSSYLCRFGDGVGNPCSSKLKRIVKSLLSRKGSVEIDIRKNVLIITDAKENAVYLIKKIKAWDNSNLTIDEIAKCFESKDSGN